MIEFEWDEAKAKSNERKHGVTFEEAVLVFGDPHVVSEQDRIVNGECRWQSIGLVRGISLLLVAHTSEDLIEDLQLEIVRIISARKANRKERARYGENHKKDIG